MQDKPIKVLLVEDNPTDVLLLRENLVEAGAVQFELAHVEWLINFAILECFLGEMVSEPTHAQRDTRPLSLLRRTSTPIGSNPVFRRWFRRVMSCSLPVPQPASK